MKINPQNHFLYKNQRAKSTFNVKQADLAKE